MAKAITPRSKDYSAWYHDLVLEAKLADYSPVKGCMVIRPHGYAVWESIQKELDRRIKAEGVRNAYFPLFIPRSFLDQEAKHVEGFAPEIACVTHAGGKVLDEPLVVRPTSETIINSLFAKWIQSYRDLPLELNQWANVVRWEHRTRLFLRTTEFLWQEGHTCHRTAEEADQRALKMIQLYQQFLEEWLAIPGFMGLKTESERFAGAKTTYCLEAVMTDGKALQAATSHDLSDHFAKAFATKYLDEEGQQRFVYQSSWGVTTRLIGALIMVHSDDQGLVLPPRVAPEHVRILPIFGKKPPEGLLPFCEDLAANLRRTSRWNDLVVTVDTDQKESLGWRRAEAELAGVPFRIEVGAKELEQGEVLWVRRDREEQLMLSKEACAAQLDERLQAFQMALLEKARRSRDERVQSFVKNEGIGPQCQKGFVMGEWCGSLACETSLKEVKASIRLILPHEKAQGECHLCGATAMHKVLMARSY
jgi:prolyl-tRNA synthetase